MSRVWLLLIGCSLISAATVASEKQEVDLIVEGDYVVTMNGDDAIIEKGAVAVNEGQIIAVAEESFINQRFQAKERLDGEQQIVMPGLINGHSHAAMTLLRGIADDLSLYEWLNHYIFPAEVAFVDPVFVRVGTQLACWEMGSSPSRCADTATAAGVWVCMTATTSGRPS